MKPAVVIFVYIVANPITPILIPLGRLNIYEVFWKGKKLSYPLSDFKLAAKFGVFLPFKKLIRN